MGNRQMRAGQVEAHHLQRLVSSRDESSNRSGGSLASVRSVAGDSIRKSTTLQRPQTTQVNVARHQRPAYLPEGARGFFMSHPAL